MQACYVNTTHPDFIGGHKVIWMLLLILILYSPTLLQATALINDRLSKVPPPQDPKNPRASVNNNKDLDVDMKKEEQSFFGSFFAPKKDSKKKGAAAMDTPPPSIRPQNALNERETMETEVISMLSRFTSLQILLRQFQNFSFIPTLTS
jgi:dynamin 1-like protein